MLKNAIAYILRKRSRTVIIFIILTIVLSCLYSCLNIIKSAISLENNLYKLSNTSLSITQNNNENFKTNQFKEIENIKEIKETIPQYGGLAKSTNVKAVEGMQMIERDDMPEEFRNIFSLRSANVEISQENGNIKMSVKGFGHGVGMSQYGADYLARQGKTYEEILKTYYTGVEIENR